MWLSDKKGNKEKKESEEKSGSVQTDEVYLKIAEIITNNDMEVISEIKDGYANPQDYIQKHHERLSEYILDEEMKDCVLNKRWLMIDILEIHNYVCVRDWKDELEDFLYFLFQTKRAIAEGIEIDQSDSALSQDGDIPQWCKIVDEKLAEKNIVVGNIDTESDQYTLFLATKQELASLEECASTVNQIISCVSD